MYEDQNDTDRLRAGLYDCDRRLAREWEKRAALLDEWAEQDARAFLLSDLPFSERFARLPSGFPAFSLPSDTPEGARAALLLAAGGGTAALRPAYIRALLARLREGGCNVTPADLLPVGAPENERISYVKSPLADEAYYLFAAGLTAPTVQYADRFRSCCEDVANGTVGYCILPYENTDGVLSSLAALADRYRLCCSALCRVFHADGANVTHFALYSKTIPPPREGGTYRLRLSLSCPDGREVSSHLLAAAAHGTEVVHLSALPPEEGEGGLLCHLTVRLSYPQLLPYLTDLAVFGNAVVFHGLYKESAI